MNIFLPENISEWFMKQNHSVFAVYMVGGAIRDQLQGTKCHDYDLVMQTGAVEFARRLANDLHLLFYIMDLERGIARVLMKENGKNLTLDFADFRGKDLSEDLRGRDFTINAMARDIYSPEVLIDPLQGKADLESRVLRACTSSSFNDDPVRCLRAVRFSYQLELKMDDTTLSSLRKTAGNLSQSSTERKRDELFNILSLHKLKPAIQDMHRYGILEDLLPEILPLVDYPQTAHHVHDAWLHTLAVMDYCRQLLEWIESPGEAVPANEFLLYAFQKIDPYRESLKEYFEDPVFQSRPLRSLFLFAALYHDTGKPSTRSETSDGVQFFDHEIAGAQIAAGRARALALSSREVGFIEAVIRHHMDIHNLVKQKNLDLRETAFDYFQATGFAGVADCLFSLADLLATYEEKMEKKRWEAGVSMSCNLLNAWFNQYKQVIEPDIWLDGDEIIKRWNLSEGPLVGQLLSALKKAQAVGKVNSKQEAIGFLEIMMNEKMGKQNDFR